MTIVKSCFRAAFCSFVLFAALFFSAPSSFATAIDALGTAYITRAALGALGVELATTSLDLSSDDVARALWYGGGSTLPPTFTYAQNLGEYFSRQTIRIRPDTVTIGGLEYSDIWLPHDCADKFRTNAFDFVTRYNIASETNGTFVSGVGTMNGFPAFDYDGVIRTQNLVVGSFGLLGADSIDSGLRGVYFNSQYFYPSLPMTIVYRLVNQQLTGFCVENGSYRTSRGSYVSGAFDFTWVASTIPVTPLPSSYGLRARVPSTYVQDLPQILDPESETYASDLARFTSAVESAASAGTLTDPAFEEWDTPVPPTGNTIADEPYSSLSGVLSGISSFLSSISSSVSGIAESIISGDAGFFSNVVSALAVPFEPIFVIFRSGVGIWHYVVSWVGTISAPFSWSLSALGSAGSFFLSPIYAAAAAAVVFAVYKKFGR